MKLTIGSRGSKLALWQAEWVRAKLSALDAKAEIAIELIKTTGDQMKSAPLAVIGGKGVFTKEIEEALLAGRIDLAVHSLKDLPTVIPDGLTLAAITEREDSRDALVVRHDLAIADRSIDGLGSAAIVGTSSPRRLAQLKYLRNDLRISELRGNVDTRLRKLDAGEYDAVILAAAGLGRLGLADRITALIPTETMMPAVGQGALAIEVRADDHKTLKLLQSLDDQATRSCCTAERALLRELGGGCQLPIAAHATFTSGRLRLDGMVASPEGTRSIRDHTSGPSEEAEALGNQLAKKLLENGARDLLAGL
jgi:hydroxymethylbilane synthase